MWYERNVMNSVCIYTLLQVVKCHCDLSVLAVSLMGFHNTVDEPWPRGRMPDSGARVPGFESSTYG